MASQHKTTEDVSRMMNWPNDRAIAAQAEAPIPDGRWNSVQQHVAQAGEDIKNVAISASREIQNTASAIDRQLGNRIGFGAAPEPEKHPEFTSDRMVHWPFES
eukprot:GILK01017908.1.p1 GENE.GILK01017908.1~~GILK01017908.1.p1  ORF type:complete len:120 (+),score=4.13 GILK01017908.1:54-362(+)